MGVFEVILIALETICSLDLIGVILLQNSKEEGLGALAGSSDTYLGRNKNGGKEQKLASATKWIAIVWVVLTLALSLF